MKKSNDFTKRINAVAPIRICDIGGWTDTWFAKHGNIFNIAVYPYVEVQLLLQERKSEKRIHINLENYQIEYSINPKEIIYDKHPLIEAAIDIMKIPETIEFHVTIFSQVPPGASTGTSAAVSVALIGALDRLTGGVMTAHEIASWAHGVETERLNLQSGIQDQLCSAYGGINYIEMHRFPYASVSQINIPNSLWWELENRLLLVYIGSPHSSSDMHKKVIAELGENAECDPRLNRIRELAKKAKDVLYAGDFDELGTVMDENTNVQRQLHKGLVCDRFEEIIEIGKKFDVVGNKVNGAGGDGGSMTLLCDGDSSKKRALMKTLSQKGYNVISPYLSRYGLRIW